MSYVPVLKQLNKKHLRLVEVLCCNVFCDSQKSVIKISEVSSLVLQFFCDSLYKRLNQNI